MFVGQIEEEVRNNCRVLTETKISHLGDEKGKERPYAIQWGSAYRTELNSL